MRRTLLAMTVIAALAFVASPSRARAETVAEEAANHPRIARAISELEDAVRYMQEAPHDFGGHKKSAIKASEHAIEELHKALKYRANQDTKHGK